MALSGEVIGGGGGGIAAASTAATHTELIVAASLPGVVLHPAKSSTHKDRHRDRASQTSDDKRRRRRERKERKRSHRHSSKADREDRRSASTKEGDTEHSTRRAGSAGASATSPASKLVAKVPDDPGPVDTQSRAVTTRSSTRVTTHSRAVTSRPAVRTAPADGSQSPSLRGAMERRRRLRERGAHDKAGGSGGHDTVGGSAFSHPLGGGDKHGESPPHLSQIGKQLSWEGQKLPAKSPLPPLARRHAGGGVVATKRKPLLSIHVDDSAAISPDAGGPATTSAAGGAGRSASGPAMMAQRVVVPSPVSTADHASDSMPALGACTMSRETILRDRLARIANGGKNPETAATAWETENEASFDEFYDRHTPTPDRRSPHQVFRSMTAHAKGLAARGKQVFNHFTRDGLHAPSQVLPHVFIGDRDDVEDLQMLKELGISHIVNCAAQVRPPRHAGEFIYLHLPLIDSEGFDMRPFLGRAMDHIDDAKRAKTRAIVHCVSGVSRAPTVVIAYMMERLRVKLSDAIQQVAAARRICRPNNGFLLMLANMEVDSMFASSVATSQDPLWNFYAFNRIKRRLPVASKRPSAVCTIQ